MRTAPFLEQALYLDSFRQLGEDQRFFLSLLFIKNNHLKIINIIKRRILRWETLLPLTYNGMLFSLQKGILTHTTIGMNLEDMTRNVTKGQIQYDAPYTRYLESYRMGVARG